VGAPHKTTLSGSGHLPAWAGDGGVNAAETHGARACLLIAGRPRKTLCPLRRRDVSTVNGARLGMRRRGPGN